MVRFFWLDALPSVIVRATPPAGRPVGIWALILVTSTGYAKLADFGLAKLENGPSLSSTGIAGEGTRRELIIGTAAYMSPEQASGRALDGRSDMFSFGVVLYEMLTGHRPFEAVSKHQVLEQVIHAQPAPLRGDVPPPLRVLVTRALEKDPRDRFLSMHELVTALRAAQQSGRHAAAKWLWTAGAGIVFAAGAAGFWKVAANREPTMSYPLRVAQVSKLTSYPGDEREPAISPDGSKVAFSWSGKDADNYDIYVVQTAGQQPLRLTDDPAPDSFPTWSSDGREIAFIRRKGTTSEIIVVPALGGSERVLYRFAEFGADLDFSQHPVLNWSRDSKWLIFSGQSDSGGKIQLFALSVESRVLHEVSSPDGVVVGDSSPALSADGKSLAFVRYLGPLNGHILIQPLGPGVIPHGRQTEVPLSELRVHSPAWLADGRQLLFADESRILEWDRSKGTVPVYASDGVLGGMSVGPTKSDDSLQVVIASEKRDEDIWSIALDKSGTKSIGPPLTLLRSTQLDNQPQYSPDGSRIAFSSMRSGSSEIWLADADGSNPRQLTHLGAHVANYPAWSPDGKQIAFHARLPDVAQIYVVDADQGRPRQITHANPGLALPTWSGDGRFLYASTLTGGTATTYRIPLDGGSIERLWAASLVRETPDHKFAMYKKTNTPGIYRRSLAGNLATNPEELVVANYWPTNQVGGFAPVQGGIYYVSMDAQGRPQPFHYFDYASRKSIEIAPAVRGLGRGFTVSPDGRRILFAASAEVGGDLLSLELR
jgi:eukaryotic-like serine/threonine-protein kinase